MSGKLKFKPRKLCACGCGDFVEIYRNSNAVFRIPCGRRRQAERKTKWMRQ